MYGLDRYLLSPDADFWVSEFVSEGSTCLKAALDIDLFSNSNIDLHQIQRGVVAAECIAVSKGHSNSRSAERVPEIAIEPDETAELVNLAIEFVEKSLEWEQYVLSDSSTHDTIRSDASKTLFDLLERLRF
ncbi:MAG: hypothetical protein AAFV37_01275 [Pseudomonadota bacterium]